MRILLIDDCVAYHEEFAELLAAGDLADVELDCVGDAKEGARILARAAHTLSFVDYRLPGSSGIELIRGARLAGVDCPIICLTGFDSRKLDLAAEAAGATAYLTKGEFSPVTLARTIRYTLRHGVNIRMPRDAESRFGLAQEAVSIGTWDWDIINNEMFWDPRMFQLYGCRPVQNKSVYDLWRRALHPATLADVEATMRASIATGKSFQTDFTIIWDDGSVHYIRTAGRVTKDITGRVDRMIGITWDVTEIRQLVSDLALARNTAEQATRAKSRFLAGVSHELRTPLNGILGYAHLLRLEGGLTEGQQARVDAMLMAGAHLLELIGRVLDLSSIEAADCELHPAWANPRLVAEACLDLVRPAAEAKSLLLGLHIAPDMPASVCTDPTRLRQVLLNLLGNAVKFTASGAIDVFVTRPSETTWRIEVADSGPGIPAEKSELLFQEFQRLSHAATESVEGAGLGLALAGRLAALLGGRVGYLDNPGGGSRFWLELPIDLAGRGAGSNALPPHAAPADPAPSAASDGMRILVVDDVAMNREVAQAFLRSAQHDVVCAESGAAAVAAVAGGAFDLVLMDVCMPGMDGLEATRRIRALQGAKAAIPIVALTAHAFAEQIEACRRAGMDAHLTKPFTPAALLSAVTRAASGKTPRGAPSDSMQDKDAMPPPTTGYFGADLPVIKTDAFAQTAACLTPDIVAGYLQTLVDRSEALLQQLRNPGRGEPGDRSVAVAAHALAGSAGMFGFERLSVTARHFEHAADAKQADLAHLTASLIAATTETVDEMKRHMAISK